MILGLDISTTTIGYTILDQNQNLIEMGHISFKRKGKVDLIKTAIEFEIKIKEILSRFNIEKVFVETPPKMYKFSKSSIDVILNLNSFVNLCAFVINKNFGLKCNFIAATTARKLAGIKMNKKTNAKQQVFDFLSKTNEFKNYTFPKTRNNTLKDFVYDELDSYIIAKSSFKLK